MVCNIGYANNLFYNYKDDSRYVRANAGCKHFAAYAGPENIPSSRYSFNAVVSLCVHSASQ